MICAIRVGSTSTRTPLRPSNLTVCCLLSRNGRADSIALRITWPRSAGSRRSSSTPRLIRDTSSRSSISRTM